MSKFRLKSVWLSIGAKLSQFSPQILNCSAQSRINWPRRTLVQPQGVLPLFQHVDWNIGDTNHSSLSYNDGFLQGKNESIAYPYQYVQFGGKNWGFNTRAAQWGTILRIFLCLRQKTHWSFRNVLWKPEATCHRHKILQIWGVFLHVWYTFFGTKAVIFRHSLNFVLRENKLLF